MTINSTYLRTGELCRQAGIDRETLRFYEAQQLLPAPRRSANGYREYPPDSLLRLQFIQQGKLAGFSLAEMAGLLNRPPGNDAHTLQQLAQQQLQRLEQRIDQLQGMRQLLLELLRQPEPSAECPCPVLRLLQRVNKQA